MHDLANAQGGHTQVLRKTVLAQPEWLHEIFEEYFARMNWRQAFFHTTIVS